ncbi:hypothetical protein KC660_04195 [Candidatus Dojkabacteria bacterium]|uniref:Uncharacterized protein n=1 Tax=Candidatus Dojkabacteria bacterium TaxID=2099670 RepID=A0A955L4N8_9BACT|nr:hypothetical protein [Candidatus Dojkabacteria bacterium]
MNSVSNLQQKLAPYLDINSPYPPTEAFGRFAQSQIDSKLNPVVQIKLIQNLAKKYNELASIERRINVFYYLVLNKEQDSSNSKIYGEYKLERLYLEKELPRDVVPIYSDEVEILEKYLTGEIQADNINTKFTKQRLEAKYKWKYKAESFIENMFSAGDSKKVSIVVLITKDQGNLADSEKVVLKDDHNRYYSEHPITLIDDSNFYVFGSFDI